MAVLNELKWGSATPGTSGGQVTWSFATLPGVIYSFDAAISSPAYQALIRAAFDAWEAVANIDFVEVADSAAVDIRLGWDAYDGAGGTVGEATYNYSPNGSGYGTLTYAEIVFDTAETWSTDRNFVGGTQMNFFTTAVHEIGHAIGLGHSADVNAIMYFATNSTINLTADDISGVRTIYGASVGGGGLTGTPGNDTLSGTPGNDVITGLAGNDLLIGFGGNDSMSGGDGDDQLLAGSGDTGNDLLYGDAGNDTLGGGAGQDTLVGGVGSDVLFGGAGNDWLDVGIHGMFTSDSAAVTNVAWAGAGADSVDGDNTSDTLGGGSGNDTIFGYGANDLLFGGKDGPGDSSNRDRFYGGDGDDRLYGGSDNDLLDGEAGADFLFGGDGQDTLAGGAGNDALWGGTGNDTLTGGTGTDTFGFIVGSGSDLVTDFEVGLDFLDLSGAATDFNNSASVSAAASNTGAGLQINLGGGAIVVLAGVTTADIVNMDFIF